MYLHNIVEQLHPYLSNYDILSLSVCCKLIRENSLRYINSFVVSIPKGERVVTISPRAVTVFSKDQIPSSAISVTFRNEFNECLDDCHLSSSLTKLYFGHRFNQNVLYLPPSLIHLSFGDKFNKPVFQLPSSLKSLAFGEEFNQFVHSLPPSLTELHLGNKFNKQVDLLPQTLKVLSFGSHFNKPITNLPHSLTQLVCGESFNQPIAYLPSSLTCLSLGRGFEFPINFLPPSVTDISCKSIKEQHLNYLPPSLKSLSLMNSSTCPQLLPLPSSLTNLIIGENNNFAVNVLGLPPSLQQFTTYAKDKLPDPLPPNLTELNSYSLYKRPTNNLPSTLKSLHLGSIFFTQTMDYFPSSLTSIDLGNYSHTIKPGQFPHLTSLTIRSYAFPIDGLLPQSLTCLAIHKYFNSTVDKLPPLLLHLTLGDRFNHSIDKLPPSLKTLSINNSFNQLIHNLPKRLTHLTLRSFNHPIDFLPMTLTHLTLTGAFNQLIISLPPLLSHLCLGDAFNQPVDSLPSPLAHLTLGLNFNQSIDCLPSSLSHLTLGQNFTHSIDHLPSSLIYLKGPFTKLDSKKVPPHLAQSLIWFFDLYNNKIGLPCVFSPPVPSLTIPSNLPFSIFDACNQGSSVMVAQLVEKFGKDVVNQVQQNGLYPIHIAAENVNDSEFIKTLISLGADANCQGENLLTPLYFATLNSHMDTIQGLIWYGADVDATTVNNASYLTIAAKNGRMDVVKLLIEMGETNINHQDLDASTPLTVVSEKGQTEYMEDLVGLGAAIEYPRFSHRGYQSIDLAAANGHLETVKKLIQLGGVPNFTTTYLASKNGHSQIVRLLLPQAYAEKALLVAVEKDFVDTVKEFLVVKTRCNINIDKCLLRAAESGSTKSARLLLDENANIKNSNAVFAATHRGHIGVLELLLERAADPRDVYCGHTALEFALKKGHKQLANILAQALTKYKA